MMTEIIYMTYSVASRSPNMSLIGTNRKELGHHIVLNYRNKNGNHFVIEALPSKPQNSFVDKAIATIAEEYKPFFNSNTDSDFGAIKVFISGTPSQKHKSLPIAHTWQGKDLSKQWNIIKETFKRIDGNFEYRPLSQNSNTSAVQALKNAGLNFRPDFSLHSENYNFIGGDEQFKDPIRSILPVNFKQLNKILEPKLVSFKPLENDNGQVSKEQIFSQSNDLVISIDNKASVGKPMTSSSKTGTETNQKTRDLFEKYAEVMGTKDQPGEVKPSAVVATKIDGKTAPLALADKALPPKGPERVDLDPSYNPFNRDKNGFEDLEGEVHIWKKDPEKKDQLIREAGREKDFGLDIDYDSAGTPLPNKGPERVKRDPGYNPFDLALNGEEDLEGEAFIWKTDPQKKNRLIRQAGRESFFGLEDISFL